MQAGESRKSPVYMKVISDVSPGKAILVMVVTIAPVVAAILMQNPALRQAILMRTWKKMELINATAASYFDKAAKQCQFKYDLARM